MNHGPWHRRARKFLPELIYGANDGIVTTLAVVAGVVGADLSSHIILILGFANLFADGFSMGASNVLSERSRAENPPTLVQAFPKGVATFSGFLCAGIIPLLAYLVPFHDGQRFVLAVGLAALTLFLVGASRALVTERSWLLAGAEMLLIGSAAAAVAYAVGIFGAALIGSGV